MWELPSSQRPGDEQAASPRPAQWVLGSPRFNGWRVWTLASVALGVCVLAGLRFAHMGEPAAEPIAQAPSAPNVEEPPPAALHRAVPAPTRAAATPVSPSASDDALVQPPRSEHSVARGSKTVRPAAEPVAQPPAPAVEPPLPEPVRVAPPPPPPPPARPVDPMQRLQDALGGCRGEDLFSRLGCEYRARSTYCEGHWGESPQCPAQTGNDHGQ